jgi:hypothetical protein
VSGESKRKSDYLEIGTSHHRDKVENCNEVADFKVISQHNIKSIASIRINSGLAKGGKLAQKKVWILPYL